MKGICLILTIIIALALIIGGYCVYKIQINPDILKDNNISDQNINDLNTNDNNTENNEDPFFKFDIDQNLKVERFAHSNCDIGVKIYLNPDDPLENITIYGTNPDANICTSMEAIYRSSEIKEGYDSTIYKIDTNKGKTFWIVYNSYYINHKNEKILDNIKNTLKIKGYVINNISYIKTDSSIPVLQ
jgi:hypothetical protein